MLSGGRHSRLPWWTAPPPRHRSPQPTFSIDSSEQGSQSQPRVQAKVAPSALLPPWGPEPRSSTMQAASVVVRGYVSASATQGPRARTAAAALPTCRSAAIPEHRAQHRAAACRRRRSGIAEAAATTLAPQATALPQLPPLDGEAFWAASVKTMSLQPERGCCCLHAPQACACKHSDLPCCEWLVLHRQAACCRPVRPHADGYESACAFTDFANWLIPGRVMLGRYPFVEPSRCRSREVGEEQLRQLIAAGVTTFISLQVG